MTIVPFKQSFRLFIGHLAEILPGVIMVVHERLIWILLPQDAEYFVGGEWLRKRKKALAVACRIDHGNDMQFRGISDVNEVLLAIDSQ